MKYIKTYTESIVYKCKEFRKESLELLSFLLDDKSISFYLSFNYNLTKHNSNLAHVSIQSAKHNIQWSKYKEDIIQYLEYMKNKHSIVLVNFSSLSYKGYTEKNSYVISYLEELEDFDFFEIDFDIRLK